MDPIDPILGSARFSTWRSYSVKGNLVAARPRYVREKWGEDGFRNVLARLDGEPKRVFESEIMPFAWFGFDVLAAIDSALVSGPMKGDITLMKAFGYEVARYDLSTLYKVLLKLGTPSFIAKRVGVIYRTYIRGGNLIAPEVESTRARIVLADGSLPMYFCTHGVAGWFTCALELSGGKRVMVHESECIHRGARHCVWKATWT
jgi:hypothetical protein